MSPKAIAQALRSSSFWTVMDTDERIPCWGDSAAISEGEDCVLNYRSFDEGRDKSEGVSGRIQPSRRWVQRRVASVTQYRLVVVCLSE